MHLVLTNRLLVVTVRSSVNAARIQVTCWHPAVCGATIWKVCTRKMKCTFLIIIKLLGSVWYHIQRFFASVRCHATAGALRCIPRVRDFHGLSTRVWASWAQGLHCFRRGRLFVCLFFCGRLRFWKNRTSRENNHFSWDQTLLKNWKSMANIVSLPTTCSFEKHCKYLLHRRRC